MHGMCATVIYVLFWQPMERPLVIRGVENFQLEGFLCFWPSVCEEFFFWHVNCHKAFCFESLITCYLAGKTLCTSFCGQICLICICPYKIFFSNLFAMAFPFYSIFYLGYCIFVFYSAAPQPPLPQLIS